MTAVNPERILPILKTSVWAEERGLFRAPLIEKPVQADITPVIVCAIDQGGELAYLPPNPFPNVPDRAVLDKAKANLERHLQSLSWTSLDYDGLQPPLRILALTDDFYASEAILSGTKLREAHSQLQCHRLLACAPIRGQLCVMAYDAPPMAHLEVFVAGCLDRYRGAASAGEEAISDSFFVIEQGDIREQLTASDLLSPPSSDKEAAAHPMPQGTLYTPAQIGIATFLGSLPAGLYMLGANYVYFGKPKSAKTIALFGLIAVPALVAAILYIPDSRYDRLVPLALGIMLGCAAFGLQGNAISTDLRTGRGRRKSLWKVAGVVFGSLLVLLMVFGIFVSLGFVSV